MILLMNLFIPNIKSAEQRLIKIASDGLKFLTNLLLARIANSVMFSNTTNVCMVKGAKASIYYGSCADLFVDININVRSPALYAQSVWMCLLSSEVFLHFRKARDSRNTNFAGVRKKNIDFNSKDIFSSCIYSVLK